MPRGLLPILIALCAVVLCLPGVASAQSGGFLSPGPLSNVHADLDRLSGCTSCHAPGQGPTPSLCMECHDDIKAQVTSGTGFHSDKGDSCGDCHPEHRGRDWNLIQLDESDFDHEGNTGFPLEGEHGRIDCEDCHEGGEWPGLDPACQSCHEDPHGSAASTRDLLTDCNLCHSAEEWKALPLPEYVFDHTDKSQTDYPLEGGHITTDCAECHEEWKFVPVAHSECASCHSDPHRADFNQRCESCHPTPRGWEVPKFDHDRTGFELEGQHTKVPSCNDCHGSHKTTPLSHDTCNDCHTDVHEGQFEPKSCDVCHDIQIAKFEIPEFDHAKSTDFPLIGRHSEITCEDCHGEGEAANYAGVFPTQDCDDCHEGTHEGRFEPAKCDTCHASTGWLDQAFDHDQTKFPRTGKHLDLECNSCHTDYQWTGLRFDSCHDCHSEDNPHEPILGPETCDSCHQTGGFQDVVFDHANETTFDLNPQHTDEKCATCHESINDFTGMESECLACHQTDRPWGHYEGNCEDCHQSSNWFPGGLGPYEHDVTGFELKGAHDLQPCESCHPAGAARGLANPDCRSCHAQDDPHRGQLSGICTDCHSETSWFKTRFRHSATGWPLRGSHRLAACTDCHAVGYIGTPTECRVCHEGEAPLNIPAHQSPEFPFCDTCHKPYIWEVQPGFVH